MFKRLLIATNFNDSIHRLVHFVPSLAAGGVEHILFYHSVALWEEGEIPRINQEAIEQARDRLSVALNDVPAGITVQVQVDSGSPETPLSKAIAAFKPDVLVLGTPIRSLLSENLLGSTTQQLLQQLAIPIMALRPPLVSTYTNEELDLRCRHLWRSLLIPFNGTDAAQRLLELLQYYVQQSNEQLGSPTVERVTLLWVLDTKGRREIPKDHQIEQAETALDRARDQLTALKITVDVEIRHGDPFAETIKCAADRDISAIATNSTYNSRWLDWSIPSLGRDLLRGSWHPVLYIPKHCTIPAK